MGFKMINRLLQTEISVFKNNRVCTCIFLFLNLKTYSSDNTAEGIFTPYVSINFNEIIGRKKYAGCLKVMDVKKQKKILLEM